MTAHFELIEVSIAHPVYCAFHAGPHLERLVVEILGGTHPAYLWVTFHNAMWPGL